MSDNLGIGYFSFNDGCLDNEDVEKAIGEKMK
jgi:hypothetical protein